MPDKDNSSAVEFEASAEQCRQARELSRARTRLLVCLWTLPVYIIAIWILLNNQRDIDAIMFIYMGMWAGFAVDMARRHCPVCHKQYFVKSILMSLRKKSCVHCGFALAHGAPKTKSNNEATF